MVCDKLFEAIDSLYETYVTVWEEICNIESPTESKQGVDKVGNYAAAIAEAHGWQVERLKQQISGDAICITMNPQSNAAPVSLSAHMDTVHPVGLFGMPAVTKDDTYIYGPGVTDDKGGVVTALLAMHALEQVGFTGRPVQLLLQSDEENSSRTSDKQTINWICEKAKNAVAFINLEGVLEGAEGKATLARKGIANYRFEITGVEAHASKCATEGASAIREAAHKIVELEKLKDAEGITCSCGVISGGTVPNTVPAYCEFVVNFRYATAQQLKTIEETVQRIGETVYVPGCSCRYTRTSLRAAMEWVERNEELLEKMNAIYEANGMPRLQPRKVNGGSDAADATVAGIPCVDSIGVVGGKIHAKGEYAVLASLKDAAKRAAAVAYCI